MTFRTDLNPADVTAWLATGPDEDALREAYVTLESRRASLWTPGHLDSFRRDRYELDARYVAELVAVKAALARAWVASGQLDPTAIAGAALTAVA